MYSKAVFDRCFDPKMMARIARGVLNGEIVAATPINQFFGFGTKKITDKREISVCSEYEGPKTKFQK